ncbi:MAG: sulfur carrier protein ThiS adenylyltransferase ThiF [Bacteroidales bacterium]|nr:sulfur carrier protein ThiS adenylyltransferase ThiF [Bacteroidales bacterium]
MRFSEIKKRLSVCRVGIAGAGGLGSNCAIALVRSGVGTVVIADFDTVNESNLNRQFFFRDQIGMPKVSALKDNLKRIDPDSHIIIHEIELNPDNIPSVFKGCDIIVEAFDRSDMKKMLIESVYRDLPGIPLVVGSGLAGYGDNNSIRSRRIDETLWLAGDESGEVSDENPPLAPRVGIVANMQANIVLEILLKGKKRYSNENNAQ